MAVKLEGDARAEALKALAESGWEEVTGRDAIHKMFQFRNFTRAFGWMTQVAIEAEKMDHHPEWSNVYKTVEVTLATHDVNGLSELDVTLARKMDQLAG
ncbi:4a-hydroxytetrahydrobiopterin dehydratase [Gymnodinialimonas sp.]